MHKKSIKTAATVLILLLSFCFLSITAQAYTDQELCDMALQHYVDTTGYRPEYCEIDGVNGNQVSIHLYNVLVNMTATSDWYSVDRDSGIGTNFMGEAIDLTPYAPTPPAQDDTNTQPQVGIESEDSETPPSPENTEDKPDYKSSEIENPENVTDDKKTAQDEMDEDNDTTKTSKTGLETFVPSQLDHSTQNTLTRNILFIVIAIFAIFSIVGVVMLKNARASVTTEHIGITKQFLQFLISSNLKCKTGSWLTMLSLMVLIGAIITAVVVLPQKEKINDTPSIAEQPREKESNKEKHEPSYLDYMETGRTQLSKSDFEGAEESFQKAIRVEPKRLEAYQCLVDTYDGMQEPEKVATTYKNGIKIIGDEYTAIHELPAGSEDFYFNAIDFFESQTETGYASQLVSDMINMTSNQEVKGKLEKKQADDTLAKRYEAYSQLLSEYTASYGNCTVVYPNAYETYLTGLCFAKLIDFNQDGAEELLVAYYDPARHNGMWIHDVEVWTYQDGELLQIFGETSMTNGDVSGYIMLTDIDNHLYLSSGTLGMPSEVYLWEYTGEQFSQARSFYYNPGVKYEIDGASVTKIECEEAFQQWQNNSVQYYLVSPDQDGNKAMAELNNTQNILQEHAMSTTP